MTYIDTVMLAVPASKKTEYLEFATRMAALYKRYGALSVQENWGDDVPAGKQNSMQSAVLLEPDEVVVVGWICWPSKAARDAAWAKMETDNAPEFTEPMPFDGRRMIFGGFEPLLSQ